MRMQMDKRPTLASWPKRVYAWEELPEPFHPALREWKESGMPPGNVTYIPQVSQKSRVCAGQPAQRWTKLFRFPR